MTYRINWLTSKNDNEIKMFDDLTWDEMCEAFSTHKVTETKNDLGFICAEFKTTDYRPAERGIYEEVDGETVKVDFEIKFNENGNTIVGRYAENIIAYNCLVFDYDGNGVNLVAKFEEFQEFKHLGYTSHNHIISGMHKFRIIFPFEVPCPIAEWALREEAFREFGGVDDRSTTAKARIFFAPTCPEAGIKYASTWNIDGFTLDWRLFSPKQQVDRVTIVNTAPVSATGTGKVRWDTFNMVQFFKDKGLYYSGAAGKHDVRCFRQHEHNTNTQGGTVVWEGSNGKWPSFYCGHSHSLTSKDFWEHYKDDKETIANYCLREETPRSKLALDWKVKYLARKLEQLIGDLDNEDNGCQ